MSSVASPAPAAETKGLGVRRELGLTALLFTSVGSVIGSGWLLGALNATTIAGPAAIISWAVGAAAVMLLALIHAELGGMFAVNGGVARFPHFAFGSLVGYGTGWIYWLGSVTLAPVEVEAAMQYADKWINEWVHFHVVHMSGGQVVLTAPGYGLAAVLMLLFTALNLWGIRRLSSANTSIVSWKVAIPVLTIIALAVTRFRTGNFSAGDGFDPAGIKGIFSAIASGGVIFSYLGFEQAIQFGGESRNPKRNIPLAVLGSMIIGTLVYVLLELAFLGSLNSHAADHGWAQLSFTNQFGPFAAIASALGLSWLAFILYVDAFLSPAGTGLIYTGSSARVAYAMGRNGYVPKPFAALSNRGVPWISIIFSFGVGMIVFRPFPGWQKLVSFITSASLIIYAIQCLSVAAMRRQLPDQERPFRLKGLNVLAPVGFVVSNLIVLFAGWTTDWKLMAAIGLGLVLLGVSQLTRSADERVPLDWRSSVWLWPWLAGLVFAVVVYFLALGQRLSSSEASERLERSLEEAKS